jgi:hypothetical protein
VASELGITNGHAARMKYTRVKQKFEGIKPIRRNPNSKRASRNKRAKDPPRFGGWKSVRYQGPLIRSGVFRHLQVWAPSLHEVTFIGQTEDGVGKL